MMGRTAEQGPFQEVFDNPVSAFGLGERGHVALVGAGGKTRLLFALAQELVRRRRRVVTTTTTKVWHWQALRAPMRVYTRQSTAWQEDVRLGLEVHGHVFLASGALDSGKTEGIAPEEADWVFEQSWLDYLLVEADGSAGLPVKAPGPHEPEVPGSCTMVIALMGLEALGAIVKPEVVFRLEYFKELTGLKPGDPISPQAVAGIFTHPNGLFKNSPPQAGRTVFLNKMERLSGPHELEALVQAIDASEARVDRIVAGSVQGADYIRLDSRHG